MSFDQHKNFAFSSVVLPPSPPLSGTSLSISDASIFPAAPFNVVVCPAASLPTVNNAEVLRVTVIVGNVLTVVREQESSIARSIEAGDQLFAAITAKTITDVEAATSDDVVRDYIILRAADSTTAKVTLDKEIVDGETFLRLKMTPL